MGGGRDDIPRSVGEASANVNESSRTAWRPVKRSAAMTTELIRPDDALMQRMQMLRSILPTLAAEVAVARREAARLRLQNATLQARIDELENRKPRGISMPLTPPPVPLQTRTTGGMPR
jgi:hypothetical protein